MRVHDQGIIYKDTDFLVLDKPSGWSVAPGKHVGGMHLLRLLPSLQFGMEDLQGEQNSPCKIPCPCPHGSRSHHGWSTA